MPEISDETYLGLTDSDFSDNPLRRYRATALDEMDADHSQVMLSYAAKLNDNMSLAIVGYSKNPGTPNPSIHPIVPSILKILL